MLFSSYTFVFGFLPLTWLAFSLAAWMGSGLVVPVLIVSSLVFYAWSGLDNLILIIISMTVNYWLGFWLAGTHSRLLLGAGIVFNLGLLSYFKYADFLASNLAHLTGWLETVHFETALPLAISFFTFLQLAYLVDAYRKKTDPHAFLDYVLFVSFFPHLIAGPLVHHNDIITQFREGRMVPRSENLAVGLSVFALGLIKKLAIADTLALYVDPTYQAASVGQSIGILAAWGATLAYTFQIYFDFSAYSDMALGLGRMFGITFPSNFNSPYRSYSIIEFWRRWHQTLSQFLRDYLYFPLGGSRCGMARTYVNLMVVMVLGGLWHGAAWNFVTWGGLHGFYLLVNHGWVAARQGPLAGIGKIPALVRGGVAWTVTFLAVVVAWVFFRAPDMTAALRIVKAMIGLESWFLPTSYAMRLGDWSGRLGFAEHLRDELFEGRSQILWLTAALAIVLLLPNSQNWMSRFALASKEKRDRPRPAIIEMVWNPTSLWAVASGVLLAIGVSLLGNYHPFLYFNF